MPSFTSQKKDVSTNSAPTAVLSARMASRSPRIVDKVTGRLALLISGSFSSTPFGQTSL